MGRAYRKKELPARFSYCCIENGMADDIFIRGKFLLPAT
jgi:hypothetical protein